MSAKAAWARYRTTDGAVVSVTEMSGSAGRPFLPGGVAADYLSVPVGTKGREVRVDLQAEGGARLVPRVPIPLPNVVSVAADGVSEVSVSVPVGTVAEYADGSVLVVDDGVLEITTDTLGNHQIKLTHGLHLPTFLEVTGT